MERIDAPGKETEPAGNRFRNIELDLMRRLDLPDGSLSRFSPAQLKKQLTQEGLDSFPPEIRLRLKVFSHLIGYSRDLNINSSENRLLLSELLFQGYRLASSRGLQEILDRLEGLSGSQELWQHRRLNINNFFQLISGFLSEKEARSLFKNIVERDGFLGIQKYLNSGEKNHPLRLRAIGYFVDSLLGGGSPDIRAAPNDPNYRDFLQLSEHFNRMLYIINRDGLSRLFSAAENLSLWSSRFLEQAVEEEMQILVGDERISREMRNYIQAQLGRMNWVDLFGDSEVQFINKDEERFALALFLRSYYPAVYRHYRELRLPYLPEEEKYPSPKFGPCFIATAVLTCPEDHLYLELLRLWRNNYLGKSKSGRVFIFVYYHTAPKILKVISRRGLLKKYLRIFLIGFSRYLWKMG